MEDRAKLGSPVDNRIYWIASGFMTSENVCQWRWVTISRASAQNERLKCIHEVDCGVYMIKRQTTEEEGPMIDQQCKTTFSQTTSRCPCCSLHAQLMNCLSWDPTRHLLMPQFAAHIAGDDHPHPPSQGRPPPTLAQSAHSHAYKPRQDHCHWSRHLYNKD